MFFHPQPLEKFCRFLLEKGLDPRRDASDEALLVVLPEDAVDDDLADEIDDFYDDMMDLDHELFDEVTETDSENYQTAGVVVNLSNGNTVYADVPSKILKQVMTILSPQELGDFVNAIVDAIENPDDRSLCQRQRDKFSDHSG